MISLHCYNNKTKISFHFCNNKTKISSHLLQQQNKDQLTLLQQQNKDQLTLLQQPNKDQLKFCKNRTNDSLHSCNNKTKQRSGDPSVTTFQQTRTKHIYCHVISWRTYLVSGRTDLAVERKLRYIHGAGTAIDAVRNPNHCPVEVHEHVYVPLGDLRVCPVNVKNKKNR